MTKEELKKWRKARKWTQEKAAEEVCYSLAQYQRFESGENDIPALVVKYIDLLGGAKPGDVI